MVLDQPMEKLGQGMMEGSRQAVVDSLADGIPVVYLDDQRRIVREHSNGRIEIVENLNETAPPLPIPPAG